MRKRLRKRIDRTGIETYRNSEWSSMLLTQMGCIKTFENVEAEPDAPERPDRRQPTDSSKDSWRNTYGGEQVQETSGGDYGNRNRCVSGPGESETVEMRRFDLGTVGQWRNTSRDPFGERTIPKASCASAFMAIRRGFTSSYPDRGGLMGTTTSFFAPVPLGLYARVMLYQMCDFTVSR